MKPDKEEINIDVIKRWANESGKKVDDFLALTKSNDPFYIQKNSEAKAKWFTEIWEKEEEVSDFWEDGKIHPRGLHYQILGEYSLTVGNKTFLYANTDQCWSVIEKGAKYSRLLGLIPYEKINDGQNPKPTIVPYFNEHNEFEVLNLKVLNDLVELALPYLIYEDTEEFIESRIRGIIKKLFEEVVYSPESEQPNYFEIWAEKSGVIPLSVAREFNATVRPAGGGEFSLDMCFKAVQKAKELNKNLHVFVLSDFDPKGRDMPKSVARKIEYVAKQFGITAFVHFVGLTKKQCIKYSLPVTPAKTPKHTDSAGGKAYTTHTKMFKEKVGRDPTELNSFLAREPDVYRNTLRGFMSPLYDERLPNKFKEATDKLKEVIQEKLNKKFNEIKDDLSNIRKEIIEKIEKLNSMLKPIIEEKMIEFKLDKLIEKHSNILDINVSEVIKDVKFNMPIVEVNEPENPLLDTRRGYLEQILKYKEFDIRESVNQSPKLK